MRMIRSRLAKLSENHVAKDIAAFVAMSLFLSSTLFWAFVGISIITFERMGQ